MMKDLTSLKTSEILNKYGSVAFKASVFSQTTIFRKSNHTKSLMQSGWHKILASERLALNEPMRKSGMDQRKSM